MKKPSRFLALLIIFCMVTAMLPGVCLTASAATISVADNGDVRQAVANADAGDTIQITGIGRVSATANDTPWVINNAVTITGGTLDILTGGIVLGADVTFKDISLSFTSNIRNAIIANGHTLTLENVTCGNHSFNLFCGGLLNSNNEPFTETIPGPGTQGSIIIKGNTSLQNKDTFGSGNIYAGNLCMGGTDEAHNGAGDNGPANVFSGDAAITITDGGSLGTVYACGGQQRIPVGQPNGKVTLPDSENYTVSGSVIVNGMAPDVIGTGSNETHIVYRGSNDQTLRLFKDITSLSLEEGHLALRNRSSLRGE